MEKGAIRKSKKQSILNDKIIMSMWFNRILHRKKTNQKELDIIQISERYHNNKLDLFSKDKFVNKKFPKNKTFLELWNIYGIRDNKNYTFTKKEKLECISEWYYTLYSEKIYFIKEYNKYSEEFYNTVKKVAKKEPDVHYNWNFPSVENFLNSNGDFFNKKYN
jgi:hypothetical protein